LVSPLFSLFPPPSPMDKTAGDLMCHPQLIRPSTPHRADVCVATHFGLPSFVAVNVYMPKDRVTTQHQGYGFVEFRTEEDADYVSPCR
jgi:RNA recognition motif-containing protein